MVKLFLNFFSTDNRLFKSLFGGKSPMVLNLMLAILAFGGALIYRLLNPGDVLTNGGVFDLLLFLLALIITVIAYARHDKNVMKCTMGAALACTVSFWLHAVYLAIGFGKVLMLIAAVAIFASHLIINTDHHSNPGKVFFNQLLSTLLMILCLIRVIVVVVAIFRAEAGTANALVNDLAGTIMTLVCINIIVSIETNLDAYRIAREAKAEK